MTNVHNIGGDVFKDMLITGAALLERNKAAVDALNVFPVPDGDTGSNMSMTMNAAVREMKNGKGQHTVSDVAHAAAHGALRGARGNSGVILSQIFRGMAKALDGLKTLGAAEIAAALENGVEAAYKAVMRPKEGTILTVARAVAVSARQDADDGANIYRVIDNMIRNGEIALAKTPEQLQVLRDAGVVDSGGKGLMLIYRGFKMALDGDSIDDFEYTDTINPEMHDNGEVILVDSIEEITFAYCTEFFIEHLTPSFQPQDVVNLQDHLQRIGDSVVCVADDTLVKVHVHTNVPGKALQMALRLGEINGVKIENMREQHRRLMEERRAQEKEYGTVAISAGEGIDKLFKDLNCDSLVYGGQTMNPSAMDIERAIRRVNARNVFVFPNNKNIILAAEQAVALVNNASSQRAVVVPTQTISQGMAGMLAFDASLGFEPNAKAMLEAASVVRSASVTKAVRSTTIDGKDINEGDYIGLLDGSITAVGTDKKAVLDALMHDLMKDEGDYITILYGQDVPEAEAKAFLESVETTYEDADVVLQWGGQPLYDYYIAVE